MKGLYFNNREGQTVLSSYEKKGLILDYITSIHELNEAEQVNINRGLIWLNGHKGELLNESFLRKLHKKLFGDVWKWAGQYRQSEKNIGIEYWKIPQEVSKLCLNTKYWIENKTYHWPELMAHFHHKLVYIHPFPNGNGRFSRILTHYLCLKNGEEVPTWMAHLPPSERRQIYIKALRKADMKNYADLIQFFSHSY